jgi:perosamine synthetase
LREVPEMGRYYFFKGRVALFAILKAMGIQPGDEVILPGFTCVVVPNAVTYLEAKPVYVDIDPNTFNIDVLKLEELLTSYPSRLTNPKAVIVQHTFGIPAEMDSIREIAKKYNLYVIEDSCHAMGSIYKNKEVGTFGDAAFFSSQWSKPVTTGLGGWAIVNNDELRPKMDALIGEFTAPSHREMFLLKLQYFMYSKFFRPSVFWFAQSAYRSLSKAGLTVGSSSNCELEYGMPGGYAKMMSPWHRDLLENQIRRLDQLIRHRKLIAALYEDLLGKKGIKTVSLPEEYKPVFLRYPLLAGNKKKVLEEARRRHIEIGDWFVSPIHPNLEGWEKVGYEKGSCPVAEGICRHIINLPTHNGINESEAEKIIDFVFKY